MECVALSVLDLWRIGAMVSFVLNGFWLALASSQIANGYLVSPLVTEQSAGGAKLATGVSRGV